MTRLRRLGFVVAMACTACHAEGPPSCDQIVEVHLRASTRINPGDDGGALPVVLRFYQLKDRAKFDGADFQALWQDDGSALGGDVLDRGELEIFPGTTEEKRYWRKAEAAYFAVVAIFRRPSETDWRRVYALLDAGAVRKACKEETFGKQTRNVLRLDHRLLVEGSSLLTEATARGG